MIVRTLLLTLALAAALPASAQYKPQTSEVVALWPNGAPGSEARRSEPEQAQDYWVRNVHNPSLTIFRPERPNGASMIVMPGGGHGMLVWTNEGLNTARTLNRMGITVFVLKYRLAREKGSSYTIEGTAAGDARRAVRWVRANAASFAVDPKRIGLMGFSAGGELVAMVANNPAPPLAQSDAIDRASGRPDFQVLVFPGPLAVGGKAIAQAPSAFLVAGSRDECCAAPTVAVYEELRKAGVPAELHMYSEAGHAFNLDETDRIAVLHWPDRLHDWLFDGGWLSR